MKIADGMTYYKFKGTLYRWRDRVCPDPENCDCTQLRGVHEFCSYIGGLSPEHALERLKKTEESDGCTILTVALEKSE